jgi:arylsulfatase A-like enzyme
MWLQQVGYQTVMIGKYLNQYGAIRSGNDPTYVPPGWDNWAALVGNWLNYHSFDVNMNGTVHRVSDGYSTSNLTGRAKAQLNSRLPSGQPLFMLLSYVAPHTDGSNVSVRAAPKHEGESTVGPPDSAAFNEADVNDKPQWIQDLPLLTQTQIDDVIRLRRVRRDALRSVDDAVAQIVATIRQHGEFANTVLIFMSDNGFLLGEHRIRAGKRLPYEESVAVPLLIRGPGFPTGPVSRMVVNVDVTATICDITGASPAGHQLDGLSLLAPLPSGERRAILLENTAGAGNPPPPPFAGVRVGHWLFVDYGATRELYDLATDPDQITNRSGVPALADVEQSLAATLDKLRRCSGTSCTVTWTNPM